MRIHLFDSRRRACTALIFAGASTLVACGGGSTPQLVQTAPPHTPPPPPPSHFAEYALPDSTSHRPAGIVAGPDGNLWFTDNIGALGRITPEGRITEFSVSAGYNVGTGIAVGNDGNIWFAVGGNAGGSGAASIGKITATGAISLFAIDSGPVPYLSQVFDVTNGPDQDLWFTASVCTAARASRGYVACVSRYPVIGKITTNAAITKFRIANNAGQIGPGPDGTLWFTESNAIGRITTVGRVISEFPVATPPDSNIYILGGITTGPDHNAWLTQTDEGLNTPATIFSGNQNIYKITASGATTAFPIPHSAEVLVGEMGITAGSDGKLWFTDSLHNALGSITTDGAITEYPIPTPSSQPSGITAGPNGTLWFTEAGQGKIGKFTP